MGFSYFLQQTINGLSVGAIYALITIGYSMVYGLLYMINFAHGDLYTFGTLLVFLFMPLLPSMLSMPVSILLGMACAAVIGMIIERCAYRPVRSAHRNMPFISALGVASILKTIAQAIWGADTYSFNSILPKGVIKIGGLMIYQKAIAVVVIATITVFIMIFIMNKTSFGMACRFIKQDVQTANLMGINTNVIIPLIYALGGFLGTFGGVIYSSYYNIVNIEMGMVGTIKAWAVVTLAGPGSFGGALVGGLLLGWVESLTGAYLSNSIREGMGYLFIVLVLMVKPMGLFGTKRLEKV